MSLLDQVAGALSGSHSGGGDTLVVTIMQLVNDPKHGGLLGLVQSFQHGGLGEVVNSWVSTGQNLPISADQISSVLGGSSLQDIAAKLGMTPEQASGHLAELLPQAVDKLTPTGQLPQGGDLLAQGLEMMKKGNLFR